MKILIIGSTGATGSLVVKQLIEQGHQVKAVVRSPEKLTAVIKDQTNLELIEAAILDIPDEKLKTYVKDCDAVVSCLGHNLSLKGIYGKPRRLVRDAVKKLCEAIKDNNKEEAVKFILMNTTGNQNKDLEEPRSLSEKIVIGLVRLLLPPQPDNEQAAEYLRTQLVHNRNYIEWVAVRPDGLINESAVSPYTIHPSPIRSPIFNAGKTSRINVAHFMTELITNDELWKEWRGRMPVIYNDEV
jgi:nucleoside-diphosphate-sugar epimerase